MPARGRGPVQSKFDGDEDRYRQLIECVASGYTRQEMADEFGVSVYTIKTWLKLEVYPYLGVEDRIYTNCKSARAVSLAYDRGILKAREHVSV